MHACTPCVCLVPTGARRVSQVTWNRCYVILHVAAWNQTWVLHKSSRCSQPLGHLSSHHTVQSFTTYELLSCLRLQPIQVGRYTIYKNTRVSFKVPDLAHPFKHPKLRAWLGWSSILQRTEQCPQDYWVPERSWKKIHRDEEGKRRAIERPSTEAFFLSAFLFFTGEETLGIQTVTAITRYLQSPQNSCLSSTLFLSLMRSQAKSQVKDFWDRSGAKPESVLPETLHREGNEWNTSNIYFSVAFKGT